MKAKNHKIIFKILKTKNAEECLDQLGADPEWRHLLFQIQGKFMTENTEQLKGSWYNEILMILDRQPWCFANP